MNPYDHEDAFKPANRCAGRLTNLAGALPFAESKDQAARIIQDAAKKYEDLFQAFIEGVEWGRANSKEKPESEFTTRPAMPRGIRAKHDVLEGNKKRGIQKNPTFQHWGTWHDLRHSAISRMLCEQKMNITLVSEYVGTSVTTLQKVYLHSKAEHTKGVNAALRITGGGK